MKIWKNSQNVKIWFYEMHEIDNQQTNNYKKKLDEFDLLRWIITKWINSINENAELLKTKKTLSRI